MALKNKIMIALLIVLGIILAAWIGRWAYVKATIETPKYDIIGGEGNFEIRKYKSTDSTDISTKTAVVLRYGWWSQPEKVKKLTNVLRTWATEKNFEIIGEPTHILYDKPWDPPFVKWNEIMFEIKNPFAKQDEPVDLGKATVATFAGGCFWCIEAPYEELDGVYKAVSGYSGGDKSDASYKLVASGKTDHKEAVQVYYDPARISYEKLLEVFWRQIDPTDDGGQFADRGPQYRTAIFYASEKERILAEKSKRDLQNSKKFAKPIATEILKFDSFFPAEEDHQDFYKKNKSYYQRYKQGSGRAGFIERIWGK